MPQPHAALNRTSDETHKKVWAKLEHAKLNASRVFNTVENARAYLMESQSLFPWSESDGFGDYDKLEALLCGASCILKEMYAAMVAGDEAAGTPPGVL